MAISDVQVTADACVLAAIKNCKYNPQAKEEYQSFVLRVQKDYAENSSKVKDGIFGAMMDVQLVNDVSHDSQPLNSIRATLPCVTSLHQRLLNGKHCLQGPVTMSFDSDFPGGR